MKNENIINKYLADKKLSIFLFLTVWIAYAVIYMTKNCFGAAMSAIVSEGIMTKTQTGTISAVFYLVYAVFQVIGGFAADRFPPERLIFIGFLGAAISNLIIYINQNYILMIAVWCFNAAVQFGVWPAVFKIVSTKLHPEHRYNGLFYISTSSLIGLVFSYGLASVVKRWQSNFLVSAIALFSIAFSWVIIYNYLKPHMSEENIRTKQADSRESAYNGNFFKLLVISGVLFVLPSIVCQTGLSVGFRTFCPLILMESYESINAQTATFINMLITIFSTCGIFTAKLIFPRICKNEMRAVSYIFLPIGILMFVLLNVGNISPVIASFAMLFIMIFLSGVSQFTTVLIPRKFEIYGRGATASGVCNAAASLGLVLSNYGFAKIADTFGWINTIKFFIYLILFIIICFIVFSPIWTNFLKKAQK